jgi:hypothetical protein
MTAIVAVETVLLVLLVVLVAGLLRSHAEILRRLGPADAETLPEPPRVERQGTRAPDLTGITPTGDAVSLSFEGSAHGPTLLAFLTSGCSTCAAFWETLAEPRLPAGVQTVIVAHGPDRERMAKLRSLAPENVPVVMSSDAWRDYRVPGAPYFVLVDQTVRGEGVASTWQALSSLVGDAIEDQQHSNGQSRARRIEETLAAAGIGPEHPSLYPGGRS